MGEFMFEDNEPEDRRLVNRRDIETCDSAAQLNEWWLSLEDLKMRLHTQIDARVATQTDDDDWLVRVCDMLSFTARGKHYIEKRMKQLGLGKGPPEDQLQKLHVRLRTAEARAHDLQLFKLAAIDILPAALLEQIEEVGRVQLREAA